MRAVRLANPKSITISDFLDVVPFSVAVARGDADAAAAQFCSLLKNVALVGAMCMVASYEARGSGTHQKTD